MKLKAFSVLVHNPHEKNQETDMHDQDQSVDGHLSMGPTPRNAEYRRKVLHTAWLSLASFVCGWVVGQRGPSILELANATHAGVQKTSALFALGAAGYLLGCLASGVTFGRFHKLMSLFWSAIGLAATTAVLPMCSSYDTQGAVYCLNFLFIGWLESGACADVARIWGLLGMRVLQILQLAYITGGAVSPVVSMFFLVDHPTEHNAIDGYANPTSTNTTSAANDLVQILSSNRSTDFAWRHEGSSQEPVERLHGHPSENGAMESSLNSRGTTAVLYAYLISSLLCTAASVPFLVNYITRRRPQSSSRKPWLESVTAEDTPPKPLRGVVLALTGLYFFLVSAVEESAQQFLFMYLVREARWPWSQAALAVSAYWLSMGVVRFLELYLPRESLPALLVLSTSSCACALGGLYVSAAAGSQAGVWSCVALTGASISLIFPASFSWLDLALERVSGSVALVIMLSSSLAGVVNPLVLGVLMQQHTYAWYLYLLMSEMALSLPLLLALFRISCFSIFSRILRKSRKSIHVEQITDDEL